MGPDIFSILKASPAVLAVLGSNPMRAWGFGHAPQKEQRPYATYQGAYGNPDNKLSCPPSWDLWGVQFDAYAKTEGEAKAVVTALRDAIEATGNYIVGWGNNGWDQPTGLWNISFTAEFWEERTS